MTDRLKLTADAAYLPWVNYQGLDTHNARLLLFPDDDNRGSGMMFEAALDYYVTANWTVGVGGRYWAWNMSNNGTGGTIDLTGAGSSPSQPSGFTAARYGVFMQSSYHWGDPSPTTFVAAMPTKAPPILAPTSRPMNWTGYYVGGHLGGGWSDDHWSDPFGSTVGAGGLINVAGFNDITRATGPIGCGQIGVNWQFASWVLGVQADADAAGIAGQNSCFTGLGGVLCGRYINTLATVTGRVGYAWDRSLVYVKGGGGWVDTAYTIFGNTNALTLGTGSTTLHSWGWRDRAVPDRRDDQRRNDRRLAVHQPVQDGRELQIRLRPVDHCGSCEVKLAAVPSGLHVDARILSGIRLPPASLPHQKLSQLLMRADPKHRIDLVFF
jgi:hypothetical protein